MFQVLRVSRFRSRFVTPLVVAARLGILVLVGTALMGVDATTSPAGAQGFFESLFGLNKPQSQQARPRLETRRLPGGRGVYMQPGFVYGEPPAAPTYGQPEPRQSARSSVPSGGYRTMCVRKCDGYYFPVSFSTSRRGLRTDTDVCQQRCPGQGELFHVRGAATDIGEAVNARGTQYKDLKSAFLYRKQLVQGCACKAPPWSSQERLRHAMYKRNGGITGPVTVAGNYRSMFRPTSGPETRTSSQRRETSEPNSRKSSAAKMSVAERAVRRDAPEKPSEASPPVARPEGRADWPDTSVAGGAHSGVVGAAPDDSKPQSAILLAQPLLGITIVPLSAALTFEPATTDDDRTVDSDEVKTGKAQDIFSKNLTTVVSAGSRSRRAQRAVTRRQQSRRVRKQAPGPVWVSGSRLVFPGN